MRTYPSAGRAPAVVSTLLLSLLLSGCDDPNCFAGECVAGVPEPQEATEEYKEYFFEIALAAEVGNVENLLRFERAVTLRLHGDPTDADRTEVETVIRELRELTGRNISLSDGAAGFHVHFIPRADFQQFIGNVPEHFDGYVQVFYLQTGEIGEAMALISTDVPDGGDRRYIIRQLITRGFGMLNLSSLHPTSIFYSGFNSVTSYALIDKFVIRTTYDPRLQPGMSRAEITAALGW